MNAVRTAITLLYASPDLVGGEILVHYPYEKKRGGKFDTNTYRHETDGQHIIPSIIKQKVGETIIIDSEQSHAVTLVESGTRIVLVSWCN